MYSLFGPDPEFEQWLESASIDELIDKVNAMATKDGSLLEFTMVADRLSASLKSSDPRYFDVNMKIGRCFSSDPKKSGLYFRRAADSAKSQLGAGSLEYFEALNALGRSMSSARTPGGKTKKVYQELLSAQEFSYGVSDLRLLPALHELQWCQFLMYGWDKKPLAIQVNERDQIIQRALSICAAHSEEAALELLNWKITQATFWAEPEHSVGTPADAIQQLETVLATIEGHAAPDPEVLNTCCARLADVYQQEGRTADAANARSKLVPRGKPFAQSDFDTLQEQSIKSALKFAQPD